MIRRSICEEVIYTCRHTVIILGLMNTVSVAKTKCIFSKYTGTLNSYLTIYEVLHSIRRTIEQTIIYFYIHKNLDEIEL